MDCSICCEKFNLSTRKKIECFSCNFQSCRKCFQTYLVEITVDPHCMNCKKDFNNDFINSNCTGVFITNTLNVHRENILLDREKGLLIETQPYVIRAKEVKKLENENREIEKQKNELRRQIALLDNESNKIYGNIARLNRGDVNNTEVEKMKFVRKCPIKDCRGFLDTHWKCGVCESKICSKCNEEKLDSHECNPDSVASMELLKKDSKPCPECGEVIFKISGCFAKDTPILLWDGSIKMSQDIIIGDQLVGDDGNKRTVLKICDGIDELYRVDQNNGMSYTVNSKHTLLLKNNQQTFEIKVDEYMLLENKQDLLGYKSSGETAQITVTDVGPGEYFGFMVDQNNYFVSPDLTCLKNCSQMFCISCKTPWNWQTGKKETGVIHNPHYYEYLNQGGRNLNGGNHRNAGDIPCGGLPDAYEFKRSFEIYKKYLNFHDIRKYSVPFENLHMRTSHVINYELRQLQVIDPVVKNRNLRVKYLLNDLTEDQFKHELQLSEKNCQKIIAFRNIYQMFADVSSDNFRQIVIFNRTLPDQEETIKFFKEQFDIFNGLVTYFNQSIEKVGKIYKCVYPAILVNTFTWINNIASHNREIKKREELRLKLAQDALNRPQVVT